MLKHLCTNNGIKVISGYPNGIVNVTHVLDTRASYNIGNVIFRHVWKVRSIAILSKLKAMPGDTICILSQKLFDVIPSYGGSSFNSKCSTIGQNTNRKKEPVYLNINFEKDET